MVLLLKVFQLIALKIDVIVETMYVLITRWSLRSPQSKFDMQSGIALSFETEVDCHN